MSHQRKNKLLEHWSNNEISKNTTTLQKRNIAEKTTNPSLIFFEYIFFKYLSMKKNRLS